MIHFIGLDDGTSLKSLPDLFSGACIATVPHDPKPGDIPDVNCLVLWFADRKTGALLTREGDDSLTFDPDKHLAVWIVTT